MRLGKVTENVLKRSVFKLHNVPNKQQGAAVGTDCALFTPSGPANSVQGILAATATFSLQAVHGGRNAVVTAANNLYSAGGQTDVLELSVLLPKDAEEATLKQIMRDANEAAVQAGAYIGGGHTEVSAAVNRPVITATAVGHISETPSGDKITPTYAGFDLVMTKWAGLGGTVLLAEERGEEFARMYPVHLIEEARKLEVCLPVASEAAVAMKSGRYPGQHDGSRQILMHDVSYGGIYAALWELASRADTGLEVDLKKIPIKQETIEICEYFELNPYELLSTGSLLVAVRDGQQLVSDLETAGIPAAVIGRLTDSNDRVICNEEERRFLEMPQADEILKVLG